jgi:leucine dehydrogenase
MHSSTFQTIRELDVPTDHERVVLCQDSSCDYRGIVAIHSTALGPAAGGTRFWNYATDQLAVDDALRLSRMMSYKNALAGIPLGGGKAVIIGDNKTANREALFRAHGRFVEMFGGTFITAEDIGTSPADMEYVLLETRHVAGLPGKSGDPSPVTAHGVFKAMQACAAHRWGSSELSGKTVAIQGCGNTGYHLGRELAQSGAKLFVADVDEQKVKRMVDEFEAVRLECSEILSAQADILAPCAFGGILNDETIPNLQVEMITGSANNQLLDNRHGEVLQSLNILYAPDYVANAGGVINGCREVLGWSSTEAERKVEEIYNTMLEILTAASEQGIPPYQVADRIAESRLTGTKRT